jgi:hypothetical protein
MVATAYSPQKTLLELRPLDYLPPDSKQESRAAQ